MKYKLNKDEVGYQAEGIKNFGDETVLLHQAIDLTYGKAWADKGFVVENFFDDKTFLDFKRETRNLLFSLWRKAGLDIPDGFELYQYHTATLNQELHLSAVEKTKLLSISDFPVPITTIENKII